MQAPPLPDFVRWWCILDDPQPDWLAEMAIAGNPDIEIADACAGGKIATDHHARAPCFRPSAAAGRSPPARASTSLGAAQEELHRAVVITRERYTRGETELTALLDLQRRYYAIAD